MQKSIVRFGLIAAATLLVLGLINALVVVPLGYHATELGGYVSILASCIMIVLGIRFFRDQENGGTLTLGQGLRIGFFISLFPALLMFVATVLIFQVWGSEFLAFADEGMQERLSAVEYAEQQKQVEQMGPLLQNPWFQGGVMFVTVLLIGLIVTVISSLILRRK